MKSLTQLRLEAENRLNDIDEEIENLSAGCKASTNLQRIKELIVEYEKLEPLWKKLDVEESEYLRTPNEDIEKTTDLFYQLGEILKPIN